MFSPAIATPADRQGGAALIYGRALSSERGHLRHRYRVHRSLQLGL
jgi:hypothetical protein